MGEGTPKARTARVSDGVKENFHLQYHPGKNYRLPNSNPIPEFDKFYRFEYSDANV
jgi:hypothetical protein